MAALKGSIVEDAALECRGHPAPGVVGGDDFLEVDVGPLAVARGTEARRGESVWLLFAPRSPRLRVRLSPSRFHRTGSKSIDQLWNSARAIASSDFSRRGSERKQSYCFGAIQRAAFSTARNGPACWKTGNVS